MLKKVKSLIWLDNPLRLLYHKIRAIIANVMYNFPHKDMLIIWITGTNWKTTTCNIVAQWLKEAWKKVFMFTTVNIIVDDEEFTNDTKMTSPDAFVLQKWLAYAKKKGCKIAVIETASHWIKMSRIWWINYDIVALTNITQDHLDLHKTMEDYVATKLEIFKKMMFYKRKEWIKKVAIVNIDSEYSELFTSETYDTLFTYWKNYKANLQPKNIKTSIEWTEFELKIPWENLEIKTKLIWEFNVYNIMCAVWIFTSLGFSRNIIEKAIYWVSWVPWRMDLLESEDGFKIYIDYAHTEDALKNVLQTLKNLDWVERIITVFWATWDRDKIKRPVMWQIVAEFSDLVILTEDDNYTEDVHEIMKDVIPWIERKEWEWFWIIPERKEAIMTALVAAKKWDIVLLAGKWDEHIIMRNDWAEQWHDKTVAKKILEEIKENKLIVRK